MDQEDIKEETQALQETRVERDRRVPEEERELIHSQLSRKRLRLPRR